MPFLVTINEEYRYWMFMLLDDDITKHCKFLPRISDHVAVHRVILLSSPLLLAIFAARTAPKTNVRKKNHIFYCTGISLSATRNNLSLVARVERDYGFVPSELSLLGNFVCLFGWLQ